MFGRLATVRMKNAEDAFAAGRLDDAFEIAIADDLSDQRRIQRLRKDLAEALLNRGQEHLLGKRFNQARIDFDRAARCGHQAKKVAQWQRRAREAAQADQALQHDQAAALGEARQRLDAGSLTGAADALADAPSENTEHAAVTDAIERQAERAEAALAAARSALKEGHLHVAAEKFEMARRMDKHLSGLTEMETKLVDNVLKTATEQFLGGRLDRVMSDLSALGDIGRNRGERVELEKSIGLARDAAQAMSDEDHTRASVLLGRLAKLNPKTGWITDVRKHLKLLEENRRALLEGPLGLLLGKKMPTGDETLAASADAPTRIAGEPRVAGFKPPVARRDDRHRVPGLPKRMLLRIDGVGSYLLLRGDRIGIGRSGPGATADLPLISDLSERQAEIVRAGEDYFVVAETGVELAGRQIDHALLQDGDRIRLSKRIRLKFRRPSLKSTAAVLELGEGVRTTTDSRRAILWSGPVLLGSTRECHIRLRSQSPGGFVLMERGGRLYIKPMGPGGQATPVVLGEQAKLGELSFSVVEWSDPSAAGRGIG